MIVPRALAVIDGEKEGHVIIYVYRLSFSKGYWWHNTFDV